MFCFVKNIKKNAFTLAELLIALGVIGILTAIAIPIVFSLAPDQNVLMAKRAFFTTETVISNLLNDPNCYPKILSRSGLDDGLGYAKCNKYGGKDNPSKLSIDDASEKLVTLFTNELDLKGEIKKEGTKYSFTTKDGIKWTFSDFNFTANDPDSYVLLTADVNGNKDPNCGQYSASGQCSDKNRTKGFDKFTMKIFARGKIQIIDCWAVMAMKIDKKLVGKEDIDSKELLADDCSAIAGDTIKTVFVGEKEYRLINNFHYNASDSSIAANVYVYLDADGNYVYNGRTYYKQPDGTFKTSDDFVYDENLNLIGRNSNGYWFEFKGDVLVRPIEDGKYRGTGSGIYTPNANGGYNGTWDNRVYDANFNTLGKYILRW